MTLLKAWLIATAVLLVGVMVWAFAPILVPLALVLLGLGGIVVVIVWAARALERWRDRRLPRQ